MTRNKKSKTIDRNTAPLKMTSKEIHDLVEEVTAQNPATREEPLVSGEFSVSYQLSMWIDESSEEIVELTAAEYVRLKRVLAWHRHLITAENLNELEELAKKAAEHDA